MRALCVFLAAFFAFSGVVFAASRVQPVPVPQEMRSSAFTVTVNNQPVDVAHAAASYDFVNFDVTGPVTVAITATEAGFWDKGVDIEPWRLGIRPVREGQTIRFKIAGPQKLSISRPGDFLNHATMLFVFAGEPPAPPPAESPSVHVLAPGVYHQSINPQSGETYYLAPGSYFFGSLNLWKVSGVKVLGRGTIVYEGVQDPKTDEGWMQKPDWHCIGALEAHDVEIDGVTCIVRARTWSIQMKDTSGFVYNDIRVIGGNPGNANQDGMDWLGGGDALVRDAFLRASDDDLAMEGNWDGYTEADMLRPGHDVQNITVENSQLSTSISNIVRAAWPQKTFNSRHFTLRDSDILHGGIGACGQTFGVLGMWGANGAKGDHSNYTFENLWLDNWYSLVQIEQEEPAVHGITFKNIWALDQPPLATSTIIGNVSDVTFDNVKYDQNRATNEAELQLITAGGAAQPKFPPPDGPVAHFTVSPPVFGPGDQVTFEADNSPHAKFTWRFGDGSEAHGRRVKHKFPDALGTALDGANGAGRFRVLLKAEDAQDREDWAAQGVVAVAKWQDAAQIPGPTLAGLAWHVYPGTWTELPDLSSQTSIFSGESPNLRADSHGFTRYATAWDGYIDIPADGGYTFHLMSRDGGRLVIDGVQIAKTGPPFAQVCGSPGNAVRYDHGSIGLRAGRHALHVEGLHAVSQGSPRLLWEGPLLPLTEIPPDAYSHARVDTAIHSN
ncbi:PA14 domain-containing protein [Telmatobacter sp. DSM 110680]|uniref:PA14 domain-containing protein n=1 Tax=Telmatobacter sp. DSM 110680 TaxID=3036704 RepID=A0AAU7DP27_9BACT